MDCIETYIEKYAVRNAGSLVRETTSFESVAKRIATPTIRANVHIVCLVICFLRLVVKRHRFLFSAQGHTRKASRDPFKCATRTFRPWDFPSCVTLILSAALAAAVYNVLLQHIFLAKRSLPLHCITLLFFSLSLLYNVQACTQLAGRTFRARTYL
jgi:hypothetical protein